MLRIAALVLVLAGCAAPQQTGGMRLELGAAAAPPAGLLDYCRRTGECEANEDASGLRGRFAPTGGARFTHVEGRASGGALFQALLAQRQQTTLTAFSRQTPLALTPDRLAQLTRVNRAVNRAIRPRTDAVLYGAAEYWTRPLQFAPAGAAQGDCEDYALEKRAALLALGWPAEALLLATAVSPRVGLHAVLVVPTDRGDIVLDNLYDRPRPLAEFDYVWLSRQTGAALGAWSQVHMAEADPLSRPSQSFHAMLQARAQERRMQADMEEVRLAEASLGEIETGMDEARLVQISPAAQQIEYAEPNAPARKDEPGQPIKRGAPVSKPERFRPEHI